jgi:hypothetical protein
VLCDRRTNELASDSVNPPDGPDGLGLRWLRSQALRRSIDDDAFSERWRRVRDEEALELTTDALQCATDASWFLLRQLLSVDRDQPPSPVEEERRGLVLRLLRVFAEERELNPRWYDRGQPLRRESQSSGER